MHYATPALRETIQKGDLSVRDLARELGYSKSHLYNVIRGIVPLRRVAAERLADLLDTDFFVLFVVSDSEGEN